jgi:hypothetical protein
MAAWEGLCGGRKIEPALSGDLRRLMVAFPDGNRIKDTAIG